MSFGMMWAWCLYGIGSQNLTWWVGYGVDMKYGGIHGVDMKYEIRMRDDYEDWYDIDMCGEYFMIDWICIVCGQYINPWDP